MELQSSKKVFNNDKAEIPQKTICRIEEGFQKLGFQIHYMGKGDSRIFTGSACITGTPYRTNGKGISPELAKASAYAELVERFSAGHFWNYSLLSDLLKEKNMIFRGNFRDERLIDDFINYAYLNTYVCASYNRVVNKVGYPVLLHKYHINDQEEDLLARKNFSNHWAKAYSLIDKDYRMVPILFIRRISGSNGLASGNSIEEAIVQGTYEIFERYCLLKVVKQKIHVPTIEISSIRDKEILKMVNFFRSINVEVMIKDFSMSNTFPVVGVFFRNRNVADDDNILKRDLYFKRLRVGSHFNIKNALMRCFTEEMQGYKLEEYQYHKNVDPIWHYWTRVMNKRYYRREGSFKSLFVNYDLIGDLTFLEDTSAVVAFDKVKSINHGDHLEDINEILKICKRNEWDLLIVDTTHPILKFPTVRVIIPMVSDAIDFYLKDFETRPILEDGIWFDSLTIHGLYDILFHDNWSRGGKNVSEFIEILEEHFSHSLNSYAINFSNFGLRDTSLWESLAFAHLSLGHMEEAKKYLLFQDGISKGFRKIDDIFYLLRRENAGLHDGKEGIKNPFTCWCPCHYCSIIYPKILYRLMTSFF